MGNSRKSQEMAHRFSARLAGLDIAGRYVLHSCDVPLCVNPAHLSVGDHEQNMRDMASRGRASRGEGRPTAKLTQDQAIQILKRLEAGESKTAIASAFGVDRTTVHYISTGRLWSYLRGEAFAYLLKEAGW
jgi:DNA-binding NarL/FixJ family response regulator